MRRLREARKNNPEIYEKEKRKERERYYKRKEEGKTKSIMEMSEREKRKQRKDWRSGSQLYYERKKRAQLLEDRLNEDSPPQTPTSDITQEENTRKNNDGRTRLGKLKRRKHIQKLKNEISVLKLKLLNETNKKNKYRMRSKRTKKNRKRGFPRENVNNLLEGQQVTTQLKKELLFSAVMKKQLNQN